MVDEEGKPLNEKDPPTETKEKDKSTDSFKNVSADPIKITYTFVPKSSDEGRDKMG